MSSSFGQTLVPNELFVRSTLVRRDDEELFDEMLSEPCGESFAPDFDPLDALEFNDDLRPFFGTPLVNRTDALSGKAEFDLGTLLECREKDRRDVMEVKEDFVVVMGPATDVSAVVSDRNEANPLERVDIRGESDGLI